MLTVNVFMASMSERHQAKRAGLRAFYESLVNAGENAGLISEPTYVPCDVAVLYGGKKWSANAADRIRYGLYEAHQGPMVVLETPVLGRAVYRNDSGLRAFIRNLWNKRNVVDLCPHFRVGLNGSFYNNADFCNVGSPPDRWRQLEAEFGIDLCDYRKQGRHILIIGQVPGDTSLLGADIVAWMRDTAQSLKQYTDRPVIIRPHPSTKPNDLKTIARALRFDRQVSIEMPPKGTIYDALRDCWATVTYSSSSAVDSLLAGVPAIAMCEASVAWPVTDHDLSRVENPTLHDREQWLYDLAYAQWSTEEIASGIVWSRFKPKLQS